MQPIQSEPNLDESFGRNLALNERRKWLREQSLKQQFDASVEQKIATFQHAIQEKADDAIATHLVDCIERLKEPFQSLIKDFYYNEHSSKELAEKYEKSDGAVRLMLWRSRNSLASCLKHKQAI